MKIDRSVCIVTGASSGIGAATARQLAGLGARVVLAARRTDRLEALARELPGAVAVTTDVTVDGEFEHLVAETVDRFGGVDVLVNNAGQGLHVPLEQLDPVDLRAVFELNVVAPLRGMQAVLPSMRSTGGGAVVNVSSATSLRVFPGLGGYSATKAALNMLSQVQDRAGRCRGHGLGRLSVGDRYRVPPAPAGRAHPGRSPDDPPGPAGARRSGDHAGHPDGRGSRPSLRPAPAHRPRGRRRLGCTARPSVQ